MVGPEIQGPRVASIEEVYAGCTWQVMFPYNAVNSNGNVKLNRRICRIMFFVKLIGHAF